jgi:hypothetical protein
MLSLATRTAMLLTLVLAGLDQVPAQQTAPARWVTHREHDERLSRDAFAGCDLDGDDRLDIAEATQGLADVAGGGGAPAFRPLDQDRSGFLSWPEFDRHFQDSVRDSGAFSFRPRAGFTLRVEKQAINPGGAAGTPGARTPDLGEVVDFTLSLVAMDEDPTMSRGEFDALIEILGQPIMDLDSLFRSIDVDQSGSLTKAELAPVVSQVPALVALAAGRGRSARPPTLNRGEALLRLDQMHPVLRRWKIQIFDAADADRDGSLRGAELGTG